MLRLLKFNYILALLIMVTIFHITAIFTQGKQESSALTIARVKYEGGGDWYNDPSAIPNVCRYIKEHTYVDINEEEATISIMDETLFSYPMLFLTGHGKIKLSEEAIKRFRTYLLKGGFLYADDDYGMDKYFRDVIKKVFPNRTWRELPFSHGIFHIHYHFKNGLPKIHEHDNKPPRGYGLFDDSGRLMIFYTYETNISDGWVNPHIYQDPPEKREAALKMGVNIILWALLH